MKRTVMALVAGSLCMPVAVSAQETFPDLERRIPHLTQRLRSNRWEARYCLLGELTRRDPETKRALETLVADRDERVANQAIVRYVKNFLRIEKTLFRPGIYLRSNGPVYGFPEVVSDGALVDHCLGRRELPRAEGDQHGEVRRALPVLDPAKVDDPRMDHSLTVVGILGKPEDAAALSPFLKSPNDYVVLEAARAVIRLGDRAKGVEALCRLADLDPVEHSFYVTEALRVLKEVDHPGLKAMVLRVLSTLDRGKGIQPNWTSDFLLLAADVVGDDVWMRK
jgi:hypothetical protein